MNTTVSKGLKPFIFKVIIIMMSLLYVFGPVHNEVNELLHTIVHSLEMPDHILSHEDTATTIRRTDIHESTSHTIHDAPHDHEVISLLEKILKGSDQGNTDSDHTLIKYQLDKHINNYTYEQIDEIFMPLAVKHRFSEKEKRICKGYLRGFLDPPKT